MFVWEVLSAHSIPRKRDAAFGALRRIRALTPDAMARAPKKKLEESVALAGSYAEQRLQALATGVDRFRRTPGLAALIRGPIMAARRALKTLPQIGEGSTSRMLLFAADRALFPVDATVGRVAQRLGYGSRQRHGSSDVRLIRGAIASELGEGSEAYRRAFLYLSQHGVSTCTDTDPHCTVCPLLRDCPYGQKRMKRVS